MRSPKVQCLERLLRSKNQAEVIAAVKVSGDELAEVPANAIMHALSKIGGPPHELKAEEPKAGPMTSAEEIKVEELKEYSEVRKRLLSVVLACCNQVGGTKL